MARISGCFGAMAVVALSFGPVMLAVSSADAIEFCDFRRATIVGTSGDNVLTGTAFNDVIAGLGGNDTINGLDGNDRICGGDGDDTILPGTGDDRTFGGPDVNTISYAGINGLNETINLSTGTASGPGGIDTNVDFVNAVGTSGPDEIVPSSFTNRMNGGPGADFVNYSSANEAILAMFLGEPATTVNLPFNDDVIVSIENTIGGPFADNITGDADRNLITSRAGDDLLFGGGGNDTLIGESGDDQIAPGTGIDTVIGGDGTFDLVRYDASTTPVAVDLGAGTATVSGDTDQLFEVEAATGGSAIDTLNGSPGNDFLFGEGGSDTLRGLAGDDFLVGSAGNDTVLGGTGVDLASFGAAPGPVTATLGAICRATGFGTDTFGHTSRTTCDIEQLVGGDSDDILNGDGNRNFLNGGRGNDTLNGISGDDTIRPGPGTDTVIGGTGVDRVDYLRTNLRIQSNLVTGLSTGDGNDTYGTGGVNDIEGFIGGSGDDIVRPNSATNPLDGNEGNDTIDYSTLATPVTVDFRAGTVAGGGGSDTIVAFEVVVGGSADDLFRPGTFSNEFDGRNGVDTVDYSERVTPVTANLQTNTGPLARYAQIERIIGGSTADTLTGSDRNVAETLEGGPGDDRLNGGGHPAPTATNRDTLRGGAGNDVLRVRLKNELVSGDGDTDLVDLATAPVGVNLLLDATGAATITEGGGAVLATIESVVGSHFDDTIVGNAGANAIDGSFGNDRVEGRAGDDTLAGGEGIDEVSFAAAGGPVNATLGTPGVQSAATGDGSDSLLDFESVRGGLGNDLLTGNELDNEIAGGPGNDTLNGVGGFDVASFADATAAVNANLATGLATGNGTDTLAAIEGLRGGTGDDRLFGDATDNTLEGGLGNDELRGAAGSDIVTFEHSTVGVVASIATGTAVGAGNDTFFGSENLEGGRAADTLTGGAGPNRIFADRTDTCIAGPGSDDVFECGFLRGQIAAGNLDTYRWRFAASGGTFRLDQHDTLASTPLFWTLLNPAATNVLTRETVALDSPPVPITRGTYVLTVDGFDATSVGEHRFDLVVGP